MYVCNFYLGTLGSILYRVFFNEVDLYLENPEYMFVKIWVGPLPKTEECEILNETLYTWVVYLINLRHPHI